MTEPAPEYKNAELVEMQVELRHEEQQESSNTIRIQLTSSEPIPIGGKWVRKIDHSPSAVDLSRLTNAAAPAPFLKDHSREIDSQIGHIIQKSVELTNKGLFAVVEMMDTPAGKEALENIRQGHTKQVSVGMRVEKWEDDEDNQIEHFTKWTPVECSLVTIGLDKNATVLQRMGYTRTDAPAQPEIQKMPAETTAAPTVDFAALTAMVQQLPDELQPEGLKALTESQNQSNPSAWLAQKLLGIANSAIAKGKEQAGKDAAQAAADQKAADQKAALADLAKIDGTEIPKSANVHTQKHNYSIMKVWNVVEHGGNLDGLEGEQSQEIVIQTNKKGGIFVPKSEIARAVLQSMGWKEAREILQAQDAANSAGTIHPTLRPDLFTTLLQAVGGWQDWGVMIVNGLNQSLKYGVQTGKATATWVDPDTQDDPNETQITTTQRDLNLHTASVYAQITRQSNIQSQPAIESILATDALIQFGIAVQDAILYGTGTAEQPRGIANTTGVGSFATLAKTGTGATTIAKPTHDNIIDLDTVLLNAHSTRQSMRWVMSPTVAGNLRKERTDPGSGIFVMGKDAMLEGYPVTKYTGAPNNQIIIGDFSQIIVGNFGPGVEMKRDEITSPGTKIRMYLDMGVSVKQPGAFVLGSGPTS